MSDTTVALEATSDGAAELKATLNPIIASINSANATWNDLNSDVVPQPNELGPSRT